MKQFNEFTSDYNIIRLICKYRIRYSNRRHKKQTLDKLSAHDKNYMSFKDATDIETLAILDIILPKRRMWFIDGQRTYKKFPGSRKLVQLGTDEKNFEILFNTVIKYRRSKKPPEFVNHLNQFIAELQHSIESQTHSFNSPRIVPEIKETNRWKQQDQINRNIPLECRPISTFSLKDRIILSLTNKFLTELFDDEFEDNSLAFRAIKEDSPIKTHHSSVSRILEYREANVGKQIWVAECDIKKFYDTVNHEKCLELFHELIEKIQKENPDVDLGGAIHLFKAYLNCYSFPENVQVLNNNEEYWNVQPQRVLNHHIGVFNWIDKDIAESKFYQRMPTSRIGVPQGGALSGLIANLMLDYADKQLKKIKGLLYIRFCDDMIIMHTNKQACKAAMRVYTKATADLNLFHHPFVNQFFEDVKKKKTFEVNGRGLNQVYDVSLKHFWNLKSKGPYRWGQLDIKNKVLPWIGFVGYEINYNGDTRIRKRSLKKELNKQNKTVNDILNRISNGSRLSVNKIYASALHKLIGMSVGRIKSYNCATSESKLCWVTGFQALNFNNISKMQLRTLDRNKYKVLNGLRHFLKLRPHPENSDVIPDGTEDNFILDKANSYYYQAGEKKIINAF